MSVSICFVCTIGIVLGSTALSLGSVLVLDVVLNWGMLSSLIMTLDSLVVAMHCFPESKCQFKLKTVKVSDLNSVVMAQDSNLDRAAYIDQVNELEAMLCDWKNCEKLKELQYTTLAKNSDYDGVLQTQDENNIFLNGGVNQIYFEFQYHYDLRNQKTITWTNKQFNSICNSRQLLRDKLKYVPIGDVWQIRLKIDTHPHLLNLAYEGLTISRDERLLALPEQRYIVQAVHAYLAMNLKEGFGDDSMFAIDTDQPNAVQMNLMAMLEWGGDWVVRRIYMHFLNCSLYRELDETYGHLQGMVTEFGVDIYLNPQNNPKQIAGRIKVEEDTNQFEGECIL